MQWARATAGVVLVFYGTWQVMNGVTHAIEPRLVARFWANQEKYTQQKRSRQC